MVEKDKITIYDVAKKANVSLATVSRVINNSNSVKKGTKEKVLKVIDDLGYKPNGVAQALATSKSTNIGVVISSANYVYISNFLNGLTEVCRDKGYHISLFPTSHSREEALTVLEKVIKSRVDGVIIFDDELDTKDFTILDNYKLPFIVVNNNYVNENTGAIVFGYEHLVRNLVIDYFNRGDKKMSFVHIHNSGQLLNRIEKQFIKTHKEYNKPFEIINCDDSYNRTYNDFYERFKSHKKEFIFAYRDSIAAAIINAATDNGLRIPQEIEVISLIGTKYSNIIRPKISNLHIDFSEVGKRSMYMLIDLIDNNLNSKHYKFDSIYIKNDSTKF